MNWDALIVERVEVYKISHGFSSVSFDTFFEFSHNSNTRRHSIKLHKRRVRTDLRQHFFTERVINLWNSLDEAVSVNSFKGKLQKIHIDGSVPSSNAVQVHNAVPSSVRSAPSLLQFRRDLKTVIVLFTIVFGCMTDCNLTFNTVRCPCNGLVREVSP